MFSWFKQLLLVALIIYVSRIYFNDTRTVESWRQNILDLTEGKLKFSDDKIPYYENELEDTTPENDSEYDFIIVGAGSAGATLAGRLSEIENATVLLVEAGSKEYPIMDIPALAFFLQFGDSENINWNYRSEPSDRYCLGFKNSQCSYPRGKVMGGTSVLNYMFATRGNKRDFDGWAKLTGDKSWSYKEMLKYLKKLENFDAKGMDVDYKLRNKNGPMHITTSSTNHDFSKYYLEAAKDLGFPNVDYNGEEQIGFSTSQLTVKNGERFSTNRAYLHPVKHRKNLFLSRDSHVNKILINKSTKFAYGVQFSKAGKLIEVKARKEVILSAGAIGSPKILMLSGIGPTAHLKELKIDVVKDASVGENFVDHIAYGGLLFTTNFTSSLNFSDALNPANPAVKDYVNDRSGLLTILASEILGYVNVDNPDPFHKQPNIELLFMSFEGIKDPVYSAVSGVSDEYRNKLLSDRLENFAYTIWPMIMKPKSRGKILLRSKNYNDKPKIYSNYLSDPDDVRILIKGIRFIMKLSKTNALQKHNSQLYNVPLPCEKYEFDSDDFWECALRTYTINIFHQSGTCKMGRKEDHTAVVNSKLKVIGIKGLRVVDASIMPDIVSAHPHIPIVAYAEKSADEIKRDWGYI